MQVLQNHTQVNLSYANATTKVIQLAYEERHLCLNYDYDMSCSFTPTKISHHHSFNTDSRITALSAKRLGLNGSSDLFQL